MSSKPKYHGKVKKAVFLLCIIAVVSVYCFMSFQIIHADGGSMQPAITKGDYVLVNCFSYLFRKPKTGDIVLVKRKTNHLTDEIELSIKRIAGIPGDSVHCQTQKDTLTLAQGEYFIVGDNSANSYDSRHYGPVKRSDIIGKVMFYGSSKQ